MLLKMFVFIWLFIINFAHIKSKSIMSAKSTRRLCGSFTSRSVRENLLSAGTAQEPSWTPSLPVFTNTTHLFPTLFTLWWAPTSGLGSKWKVTQSNQWLWPRSCLVLNSNKLTYRFVLPNRSRLLWTCCWRIRKRTVKKILLRTWEVRSSLWRRWTNSSTLPKDMWTKLWYVVLFVSFIIIIFF